MKLGALVLVSVVLLAGCGGNSDAKSTAPTKGGTSSSSAAPATLTLDEVASVACDGTYTVRKRSDLEWFTSKGATCGRTEVWLFDSPGARDNWTSVAKSNGRGVVGVNWAVNPADDKVMQRVQDQLGGKVYGGF